MYWDKMRNADTLGVGKIRFNPNGYKSQGQAAQGADVANERLQTELDIDINHVLSSKDDELKDYLKSRNFTDTHLEIFSDYLTEVGMNLSSEADRKPYFYKAIELLDYADELTESMSFIRINKKNDIKKVLKKNANSD